MLDVDAAADARLGAQPCRQAMKDLDRKQHPAVRRILDRMDPIGYLLTELFHLLGLFAIGGATV